MNNSEVDSTSAGETEATLNPFPGLRPFRTDEDYIFFGRDDQTGELLGRLRRHRFLAVVGSSGSGKSSLVRAGLLPALYGGTIVEVGSSWEVAVMRPAGNPLFHLARALCDAELYDEGAEDMLFHVQATLRRSRRGLIEAVRQSSIADGTNLLLVVDQFEEIFRFGQGGRFHVDAAVDFVDLLLQASREEKAPVYVVITMRADFLGDCAQFPGLVEAINDGKYLIPRLGRDQLRAAIEGPVRVAGAEMAQRLAHRLLNDVGDDHDQLPVLQHALMRTWDCWVKDHAEGEPVDLRHFEATGGLKEALSRHADEVYDALPDARHRLVAEKLFKTITEHDPDERGVRRPTRLSDAARITGAEEREIATVVEAFRRPGRTFLTPYNVPLVSDTVIDISHESFMRVWRRLQRWVEEESQAARIYRRLADTAQLQAEGKAGLYRDPDLQIASSWRDNERPRPAWGEQYHPGFEQAMAFLEESEGAARAEADAREAARQREVTQAKRLAEAERVSARNFKRFATSMAVLAVVAVGLAVWALWLEGRARESETRAAASAEKAEASRIVAETAQAEALDAKAVAEDLLETSRHEQGVTWLERARLLLQDNRALEAKILASKALGFGGAPEEDQAFRDENPVLLKSESPAWQAARDLLTEPEFAPVWSSPARFHHEDPDVVRVRYSTDGRYLMSATLKDNDRGQAVVWDTSSGEDVVTLEWDAGGEKLNAPEFRFDGSLLAAPVGETVFLWRIPSEEPLPRIASTVGEVRRVSFKPGETVLALGGTRGVSLYDYESGQNTLLETGEENAEEPIAATDDLSWSPDGSLLAVLARGVARIWDVATGSSTPPRDFAGSRLVSFSPDGSLLVAAGSVSYFWDVAERKLLDLPGPVPGEGSFQDLAFHPSGKLLALCDQQGRIHLWNSEQIGTLDAETACHSVAFSADRTVLASGGSDRRIRFWNLFDGDGRVEGLGGDRSNLAYYELTDEQRMGPDIAPLAEQVAVSPDGELIASAGASSPGSHGAVLVRRMATGEVVWSKPIDQPGLVGFSPDGSLLAVSARGFQAHGSILVYDVASWTFTHSAPVRGPAGFSPDGSTLAALDTASVVLYDLARGKERADVPHLVPGASLIAFSPDGSKFCVAGTSRIKLFTWPDADPIGLSIGLPANVSDLEFSPDGTKLAALLASEVVEFWDVSGDEVVSLPSLNVGVGEVLAFSPAGDRLAVGGLQGTRLWDVRADSRFVELATLPTGWTTGLAFGPDGATLFAAVRGAGGSVRAWEVPNRRLAALSVDDRVTALTHSPDGRLLFCGRSDGRISILDAVTGEEAHVVEGSNEEVRDIAVTHDGRLLASTAGVYASLWNAETLEPPRTFGYNQAVLNVRFSADGTRLLAAGATTGVFSWDVVTGSPVFARGHEGGVLASVRCSPDGQVIAAAGSDGTVILWDVTTSREPKRIKGQCVAFSPSGTLLATGLRDRTIRLWTPAGDPVGVMEGHAAPVVRLEFSRDDTRLASGGQDGTTRLWDVSTRLPLAVFRPQDRRSVQSVPFSFSPDGSSLALAMGRPGEEVAVYDVRQPIPDASRYASYLDWYRVDGRDVKPRIRRNLYRPIELHEEPRQPGSHLAIFGREQPEVEKRRTLFRECLKSWNWSGAAALLKRLPEAESGRERDLLSSTLLRAARLESKRGLTALALRRLQLAEDVTGATPATWRERAAVFLRAGRIIDARDASERGAELALAEGEAGRQALRELLIDRLRLELSEGAFAEAQEALGAVWALGGGGRGANSREAIALEYVRRYGEARAGRTDEAGRPSDRDDEAAASILEVFLAAYSSSESEALDLNRLDSFSLGLPVWDAELVRRDAVWKYSDEGVEPDPRWMHGDFDDAAWSSGPGPLGFGDRQATSIRRDASGSGQSGIAFYFRHAFDLKELPDADELIVRVARDDGVAVYLNGEEIVRDNLPSGALSSQVLSVQSMGGAAETEVHEFSVPLDRLRKGTNLLAAEVHQVDSGSSDIHFALDLSARTTPSGRFLRYLEVRESAEFHGTLDRAVAILPASMRAELEALLVLACPLDANDASVPPAVAGDADAWRARRRVQQALARRAAAADAARRECTLRMANTAEPDWSRVAELAAALRTYGELSVAEELLRRKFDLDASPSRDAVQLFVRIGVELGRDLVEIIDALPKHVSDVFPLPIWLRTLRVMREDGAVRINCGGGEYASAAGVVWMADRHFERGRVFAVSHDIRDTDDDQIYQTERWFGIQQTQPSAYRIPIGSGRFRVTLHFAEIYSERGRLFDVLLEGERFLENYDPVAAVGFATADRRSGEVSVSDGWLDVGILSRDVQSGRYPQICAIEVERME